MSDAALSTALNAARLLKEFLGRDEQLGPAELGRRLGLGKSTVHRLLTTLAAEGLIEQDPFTGGYRLESSYTLRLCTETGRRVPAHCTSSGKVLLAFLPGGKAAARLGGGGVPADARARHDGDYHDRSTGPCR